MGSGRGGTIIKVLRLLRVPLLFHVIIIDCLDFQTFSYFLILSLPFSNLLSLELYLTFSNCL